MQALARNASCAWSEQEGFASEERRVEAGPVRVRVYCRIAVEMAWGHRCLCPTVFVV
jgi:hypothetical protein